MLLRASMLDVESHRRLLCGAREIIEKSVIISSYILHLLIVTYSPLRDEGSVVREQEFGESDRSLLWLCMCLIESKQ